MHASALGLLQSSRAAPAGGWTRDAFLAAVAKALQSGLSVEMVGGKRTLVDASERHAKRTGMAAAELERLLEGIYHQWRSRGGSAGSTGIS